MISINRNNETRSEYVGMVSNTPAAVLHGNPAQKVCHPQPSPAETSAKVVYDSDEPGDICSCSATLMENLEINFTLVSFI